jgi:hypothetical protein
MSKRFTVVSHEDADLRAVPRESPGLFACHPRPVNGYPTTSAVARPELDPRLALSSRRYWWAFFRFDRRVRRIGRSRAGNGEPSLQEVSETFARSGPQPEWR